jgi:hypothetical protein
MPYASQILKKNEEFFINMDYKDVVNDHADEDTQINEIYEEINRIKSIYLISSPSIKQVFWKYLQTIIVALQRL